MTPRGFQEEGIAPVAKDRINKTSNVQSVIPFSVDIDWHPVSRCVSKVRIRKHRLAAFGEGKDALDAVGMDHRAPVLIHHDLDGLLYSLSLSHLNGTFDRLHRRRRVVCDLLGDAEHSRPSARLWDGLR